MKLLSFVAALAVSVAMSAQVEVPSERLNQSKFRQLGTELPTPNQYRSGSGAPGHAYYQQQADYQIAITLDEANHRIDGTETIRYTNNSPDALRYLWVQLDQNMRAPGSMTKKSRGGEMPTHITPEQVQKRYIDEFPGGFHIHYVKDAVGRPLPHTIVNTMMRVDLTKPLNPGQSMSFSIAWDYTVNNRMINYGRSGYEMFEEENNALYTIAQFYPRMAVYNDHEGWQNKQFLGSGEFALPFGNYKVSITVPADHLVAATGELTNESSVLSATQRKRLAQARKSYDQPVIIATQAEAIEREQGRATRTKTWSFSAKNVRDFAFASSRKFIWDAQAVKIGNRTCLAESFYPKEGNPLWEQYSTRIVAHTLEVYSKHTIDYPYPRAISVHSRSIGMEYPMICFNGGRPNEDGTYSAATKYGMLGVIIHEVGHNFFPMIINSDERQWTWMDEGLNTFVQYLAEQEWDHDYPSRRGPAHKITPYMSSPPMQMMPIMTNSESIKQFGNNAYGKPATALNILRETVLGRELFDYAFKTYCEQWAFKHPEPADLFRTMEDASGVDLDWFWRGWFYTTEYTDQALTRVRIAQVPTLDPETLENQRRNVRVEDHRHIGRTRNLTELAPTVVDSRPEARDFYNDVYNPDAVRTSEARQMEGLAEGPDGFLHEVTVRNEGGLIMPVIVAYHFEDGTMHVERWPAEIWIKNEEVFSKTIYLPQRAVRIEIDPFLEVADIERDNNSWPQRVDHHLEAIPPRSRYEQYRYNPMREARVAQGE